MQTVNTLFQKHCHEVIKKLSGNDLDNFKNAKDDKDRIRILFGRAKDTVLTLKSIGKNLEETEKLKLIGNKLYAKKEYGKAISTYSEGIRICPQKEGAGKELLAILISNRSAAYFELQKINETLKDVDYVLKTGGYPKGLLYKIWLRKAKCYENLRNKDLAIECYEIGSEYLALSSLDDKSKQTKVKEIEKSLKNLKENNTSGNDKEIIKLNATGKFPAGDKYPAAHSDITIDEDRIQGRFARAVNDIDAGTKIIEEYPHSAVLVSKKSLTNCQNCFVAVNQPVACPNCSDVVFCSTGCAKIALSTYHKVECTIQPTIFESGVSVNCSLALRIITQREIDYFLNKNYDNISKKKSYTYDDYDNILLLCTNKEDVKEETIVHYSVMSVFLLRLLKTTSYFKYETVNDTLTEEEALIGSLLLRHLLILQFNAHEISELINVACSSNDKEDSYKSEHIGAGVYPTLALFNHSCDPSIIRYNVGSKMIVHTIKPLKAGDIIYENYGPLYTNTEKDERQTFLKDRYCFECLCKPCVEMWPELDDMEGDIIRVPCKRPRCPKIFDLNKNIECPFLSCNLCNEMTSLFPYLKGLMALEEIIPLAEDQYHDGNYKEALLLFLKAINIYYKYSAPPFPDLVKVQQRLRSCMVHLGNKCLDYKPPSI